MSDTPAIGISHVNLRCRDLDAQIAFYRDVVGLQLVDRGIMRGDIDIAFLTGEPRDHHQLALSEGRPEGEGSGAFGHVAFRLDTLERLRALHRRLEAASVEGMLLITHGNAWSIYFRDPEGNMVEGFVDSPWHVPQPEGKPYDLFQSDEDLLRWTEETFGELPGFRPMADYKADWRDGNPPPRGKSRHGEL